MVVPKLVLLGLCLFAMTLVVPAFIWGNTSNWRRAFDAWKENAIYLGALYGIGLLFWLGSLAIR